MEPSDGYIERRTLCLPNHAQATITHGGETGFADALQTLFYAAESNAIERLVLLKAKLKAASTYDFWAILMEEMCEITGSQCGFVAKRVLVDDSDIAVETPAIGEPGSCLLGVVFYLNNGSDVKTLHRDYQYQAYGTPCAHMRHDKVFIVPERLADFTPENPNQLPWKRSEAFIGVPLWSEGKCFAHFGLIWSSEGESRRRLSWGFIEMFLHALEDLILERIVAGDGFAQGASCSSVTAPTKVVPTQAVSPGQSLKPYARSISHELRTPMHGVIGMLDVMHATVLEALEKEEAEAGRAVFEDLRQSIEDVQDSSRRAVEAADNVIYAYDLNMKMPDTPLSPPESVVVPRSRPAILSLDDISTPQDGCSRGKRIRDEECESPAAKRPAQLKDVEKMRTPQSAPPGPSNTSGTTENEFPFPPMDTISPSPSLAITPTDTVINLRKFMIFSLDKALRRWQRAVKHQSFRDVNDTIVMERRGSDNVLYTQVVALSIAPDVPETLTTDEDFLHFAIQKILDNAVKFTENGSIAIDLRMSSNNNIIEVRVIDTGCGMSEEVKMHLFEPHFQADSSIARRREGLGLSLFNAKAHVRLILEGDMSLEYSETSGPFRGSEFLIRLPRALSRKTKPLPGFAPTLAGKAPHTPAGTLERSQTEYSSPSPLRAAIARPKSMRPNINSKLGRDCPLNILVAEDNPLNRNIVIGALKKLGYSPSNVVLAFDGVQAFACYEASLLGPLDQRINAVLMDIWMPTMDGYEATEKILKLAQSQGLDLPVVGVTADITDESREKAKLAGMRGYLPKPFKVVELQNVILEHFQRKG